MKISFKTLILFVFILGIFSGVSNAQKKQELDSLKGTIHHILDHPLIDRDALQDSIAIYAVNFKLEIRKKRGNRTKVTRMTVNDPLAYKLISSYKNLYTVNYSALIGDRKKIRLIIPVLIFNASSEKRPYEKEDGSPLIDMNSALSAAYALSSTMAYDNRKEAEYPLYYREDIKRIEDAIFLSPCIIEIRNGKNEKSKDKSSD